jgi:plasmid rolling circle replication initiator protein Rep
MYQLDNSIIKTDLQDNAVLRDISKSGRIRPWKPKKDDSLDIAGSFRRNGDLLRAKRMQYCGSDLEFAVYHDGTRKLKSAQFCKNRLCPMCAWRKSLLIYHQTLDLIGEIRKEYKSIRFLFLTLTIQNCNLFELSSCMDDLQAGLNKLLRRKDLKVIRGCFYAYEITINRLLGTAHPHIHLLLAVNGNYFSKGYIKHDSWVSMWRESCNLDYDPIVDIRPFKGDIEKATAEAAKYTVKGSDYIFTDKELQDLTVDILDSALYGRRVIGYRGIFKDMRRKLNQVDVEKADLTDLGIENDDQNLNYLYLERYHFHIGVGFADSNYYLV